MLFGEFMIFYIFVFRSKTDVFSFIDKLKFNSVFSQTVGTPKEANVGCGLSVKVEKASFLKAKSLLSVYNFPSFFGVYKIEKQGLRQSTSKII